MKLVTFTEAGKLVGISQDQVRKWVAEGKLALKDDNFPKRVDAADVLRIFKDWERKPRARKDWPKLRDVCKTCGIHAEGIHAAWKQKRRLAALGDVPKLGYDLRRACRARSWILCISPLHAKRLITAYTDRATSPPGWIPSKDGKTPFPDRFPKITRGHLMWERRTGARLGERLEEQFFTITTGGHVRSVLHFREDQIERLNASVLNIAPSENGHTQPKARSKPESNVAIRPAKRGRLGRGDARTPADVLADEKLVRDYTAAGCGYKEFVRRLSGDWTVKQLKRVLSRERMRQQRLTK